MLALFRQIFCILATFVFWVCYVFLVISFIIFGLAFLVMILTGIGIFVFGLFPGTQGAAAIAATVFVIAFAIALGAIVAVIVLSVIVGIAYWLMGLARCMPPDAFLTASAASGFTSQTSSFRFPFPPIPPAFPGLPGFDLAKFLECLATAMMPCHCPGGRLPLPKTPEDVWKDALGRIREGKRVLEEGRRDAEERANELKDWIEQAADKATQEAKDLAKQAEKEANKFKEGAKSASAAAGQVLSNILPPPPFS